MAYRGTFEYTLDAKNRLTVPPKFRAGFAEGVVVARRIDNPRCLSLWRPEEYESYSQAALATLAPLSPRRTELERFLFAKSHDTELDSAGRVMIPADPLRVLTGEREVVITGAGQCLEVWSQAAWSEYDSTLATAVSDFTSTLDAAA
ncbi:MAG: division/cell wall cluster transcriptional repressor MraZ [Solirubrobacteraceae bacterium]